MQRQRTGHNIIMVPLADFGGRVMPMLILDGGRHVVAVIEWLKTRWFEQKRSGSLIEAVKAVGLLHDYWEAARAKGRFRHGSVENLLAAFGEALMRGSYQPGEPCQLDLYWAPRPNQATKYIKHAERFADFCLREPDPEDMAERQLLASVRSAWSAVAASGGILGHLVKARTLPFVAHTFGGGLGETAGGGRPTPFPEDRIFDLITRGCRRSRILSDASLPLHVREYNVRNQLAYLLIFGGGIRSEELFHIFSNDIRQGRDGSAHVNLYHPSRGAIRWRPIGRAAEVLTDRQTYLWERFQLLPRFQLDRRHRYWAGWKNLLLTKGDPHYYAKIFWIKPEFGMIFWRLHAIYVKYILSRSPDRHPYYFKSLDGRTRGTPWTMGSFQDSWKASLQKIGLEQSREFGTNPHGARHWYGQTAADMGLDPRIRQIMMHHRHIHSQLRYQQPSAEQVNDAVSSAQQRMLGSLAPNLEALRPEAQNYPGIDERLIEDLVTSCSAQEAIGMDCSWELFRNDPSQIMTGWKFYRRGAGL